MKKLQAWSKKRENINMDVKDAMGTNVHCELQLAKLVRDKQLVDAVIFAKAKRMWAHALTYTNSISIRLYEYCERIHSNI